MKVVWAPTAIRHLAALRRHIERDSERNAAQVAERILRAVDLLATQPAMGRPGRVHGTRELVVADTGFIIPYRACGERLDLIAIFRGRQRWPEKLC